MKKPHLTKRTKLAKKLMFVALAALTFQSCIKDNFDMKKIAEVKWDPNFAVPLVYTSLSMKDILNLKSDKDQLLIESDGSFTLVYTNNITSLDASSMSSLSLPDQAPPSVTVSTASAIGTISNGSFATINNTQPITFSTTVTPSTIDSIFFKGGTINFSVSSGIHSNVDMIISIPAAKKNGVGFSKTITLNYTGSSPVVSSSSVDLTGYRFDMTQGSTTSNKFDVNYVVKVYGPVTITGAEQFQVSASMNSLAYSKVVGNIGQQSIIGKKDSVALTIFNHSDGAGSFNIVNPKIKFITHNSFGIPIDAQLTELYGKNDGSAPYQILNSLPYALPTSTPNLNQAGLSAIAADSIVVGGANNIVSVLNKTPKQIVYTLSAQTNTVAASQTDFVLDTSKFRLDVEVQLPLNGAAIAFVMVDTEKFSIPNNILDNFSTGLLRISNTNGFPIDLNMGIYFVDSANVKLDSLLDFEQPIITSGVLNSSGKIISPLVTNKDITIDSQRIKRIANTQKLLIRASASTATSGNIKIYSDYKLEVKIGLQVQIDAKFKPNN
jgi:hypothetical protein